MKEYWVKFWRTQLRTGYARVSTRPPRQTASVSVRNKQGAFRSEYGYQGKLQRYTLRPFNGGTTDHSQNVQTFAARGPNPVPPVLIFRDIPAENLLKLHDMRYNVLGTAKPLVKFRRRVFVPVSLWGYSIGCRPI